MSPIPVARKGILRKGHLRGSGPGEPSGPNGTPEKEWNLVGTQADSKNLLKRFEGGEDSNGEAVGGQNP